MLHYAVDDEDTIKPRKCWLCTFVLMNRDVLMLSIKFSSPFPFYFMISYCGCSCRNIVLVIK
jgi:hypothetical protein